MLLHLGMLHLPAAILVFQGIHLIAAYTAERGWFYGLCYLKIPFKINTIRTDNGHEIPLAREIQGYTTYLHHKPRTFRLNGKVERSHGTDQREFTATNLYRWYWPACHIGRMGGFLQLLPTSWRLGRKNSVWTFNRKNEIIILVCRSYFYHTKITPALYFQASIGKTKQFQQLSILGYHKSRNHHSTIA